MYKGNRPYSGFCYKEQEVAVKLKLLNRHKILALHGMPGCGKTTVAISVLRTNPDLVEKKEQEVAVKLKLLNRHKILALHGMPGCGKTTVAISVLRTNPDLITNNFNGVVFWLNFGNCKTEDDITAMQNK
ncbi:unnamed protein product [Parnassius apollo]|uniref:(apollo) hypothetical protein n=1 Tax=Parnassius apollo TaxID=110799 RepID=A0A8S3WQ23_PARAO|nr:unnamed protein product [Parnassius apollo]